MSEAEWTVYCEEATKIEARSILAMAQAAVYPHAGKSAQRLWDSWLARAYPPSSRAPETLTAAEGAARIRGWIRGLGLVAN